MGISSAFVHVLYDLTWAACKPSRSLACADTGGCRLRGRAACGSAKARGMLLVTRWLLGLKATAAWLLLLVMAAGRPASKGAGVAGLDAMGADERCLDSCLAGW